MSANNIKVEIMQYKKDNKSSLFVLLGLLFNVVYFLIIYKNNDNFYFDLNIGLSVLYNLIFMLIVFLSSENIKIYNRKFSIILFVIGLLQIVRILFYPIKAYQVGVLSYNSYIITMVSLSISGLFIIAGSISSFIKSTKLKRFHEGE